MKLKYFMRGLGTGIILTTIVLFSFRQSSKQELSNEQIMKKATALGMEMKAKGIDLDSLNSDVSNQANDSNVENTKQTDLNSESIGESSKSKDTNADNSKETKTSTSNTKNEDASSSNDKIENQDANKQRVSEKEDTSSKNMIQYVTATISSGMRATQVASYLKSIGVIDNEDEFVDYIKDQKSQSKICADTYKIPESASNSEILNIITKNK